MYEGGVSVVSPSKVFASAPPLVWVKNPPTAEAIHDKIPHTKALQSILLVLIANGSGNLYL